MDGGGKMTEKISVLPIIHDDIWRSECSVCNKNIAAGKVLLVIAEGNKLLGIVPEKENLVHCGKTYPIPLYIDDVEEAKNLAMTLEHLIGAQSLGEQPVIIIDLLTEITQEQVSIELKKGKGT